MRTFILTLVLLSLTSVSEAHEVHASNVVITVQDNHVEILHTVPLGTAKDIAETMGQGIASKSDITLGISSGWKVTGESSACTMRKQAHRTIDDHHQIQLRFLFSCEGSRFPVSITPDWLSYAPSNHFFMLDIQKGQLKRNHVIQHRGTMIKLADLSLAAF